MRSTRPDVRNPLLQLETARRLGDWLDQNTAQVLAIFLTELSADARKRAVECWSKHKAPMALYWKVIAVYARHLAQLCRAIARADTAPSPLLAAAKVIQLTPATRTWLHQNDPKALEQLDRAIAVKEAA